MTFETRAAELNIDGWLINNCFQLDDGSWRVSVREPGKKGACSAFAAGDTPLDALNRAMKTVITEERTALEDMLG